MIRPAAVVVGQSGGRCERVCALCGAPELCGRGMSTAVVTVEKGARVVCACFAVPRGPQNRGALSAKEHAGTRQTVTVYIRHASQVYSQYDPIEFQSWPGRSR